MATMANTPSKTERRISEIVRCLKRAYPDSLTYEDLARRTDTSHDVLLYVTTALVEVGRLSRDETPDGPGRPRVQFTWVPEDTGSS